MPFRRPFGSSGQCVGASQVDRSFNAADIVLHHSNGLINGVAPSIFYQPIVSVFLLTSTPRLAIHQLVPFVVFFVEFFSSSGTCASTLTLKRLTILHSNVFCFLSAFHAAGATDGESCTFTSRTYSIGDVWYPRLGQRGALYCVACICQEVALSCFSHGPLTNLLPTCESCFE